MLLPKREVLAGRSRRTHIIAKQPRLKGDVAHRDAETVSRKSHKATSSIQNRPLQNKAQHTSAPVLPAPKNTTPSFRCPCPTAPVSRSLHRECGRSPYALTSCGRNCCRVPCVHPAHRTLYICIKYFGFAVNSNQLSPTNTQVDTSFNPVQRPLLPAL